MCDLCLPSGGGGGGGVGEPGCGLSVSLSGDV